MSAVVGGGEAGSAVLIGGWARSLVALAAVLGGGKPVSEGVNGGCAWELSVFSFVVGGNKAGPVVVAGGSGRGMAFLKSALSLTLTLIPFS